MMTGADVKSEGIDANANLPDPSQAASQTAPTGRIRYKSYRKKYRKMHLEFSSKMDEAHALFAAEFKAAETARRIQEENDKILDVLLSINRCASVPSKHRYNLASPTTHPISSLPPLDDEHPYSLPPPANSLEQLARRTAHTFSQSNDVSNLPVDLRELLHQPLPRSNKDDLALPRPILRAYPSAEQEEQSLATVDKALSQLPSGATIPPESELKMLYANEEKTDAKSGSIKRQRDINLQHEFALQSSVSVHNWLQRHSQHISNANKDKGDAGSDKGKSPPPKKKGRSIKKEDKADPDPLDEELGADPEPPAKGKRKRLADGEDAYRPKGGSGAKKRKRASETGDDGKKKTKKLNGNGFDTGQDE